MSDWLDQYRDELMWIHTLLIWILCVFLPLGLASAGVSPAWIFLSALIGFCQNIGVVHEMAHRRLTGPRGLAEVLARLQHALGGLRYSMTKFLHISHHKFLGTSKDPDRLGYLTTATRQDKLRYLLLIGPLRKRFAPVDSESVMKMLSPEKRVELDNTTRMENVILIVLHLTLFGMMGAAYFAVFAALLVANVFSNVREVCEHGDWGRAAYVNLERTPLSVLFFATPGFWYHGVHHMHPQIHYLSIPRWATTLEAKKDLPLIQDRQMFDYLWSEKS